MLGMQRPSHPALSSEEDLTNKLSTKGYIECVLCSERFTNISNLYIHINNLHPITSRRKSALRAGNNLKKFAAFTADGSDSDDFVAEDSDDSSSDVSSDTDASNSENERDDFSENSEVGNTARLPNYKQCVYNYPRAYNDWYRHEKKQYERKLDHITDTILQSIEFDERVSISVNNSDLSSLSSLSLQLFCIGYAGGTVKITKWVPRTNLLVLGVSNSNHIVNFTNPTLSAIQIWHFDPDETKLKFVYSLKTPTFSDFAIFPYHNKDWDHFYLCLGCKSCVVLYKLPVSKLSDQYYEVGQTSLKLNVCRGSSDLTITKVCWSLYDNQVNIVGGTSDGHLLKWNIDKNRLKDKVIVLPDYKIPAHLINPITSISVSPQGNDFLCSTSYESRLKIWDLKNPKNPVIIKVKPQKQMVLSPKLHWFHFWRCIIVLANMPTPKTPRHTSTRMFLFRAFNRTGTQLSAFQPQNLLPQEFDHSYRCFEVCDKHMGIVAGSQNGTVLMCRILKPYKVSKSKENNHCSEHYHYLTCTSTVKNNYNLDKDFTNDQDYINHFDISLSTDFSSTCAPEKAQAQVSKKCLDSVVAVDWNEENICVCYMTGLFVVLRAPDVLTTHRV